MHHMELVSAPVLYRVLVYVNSYDGKNPHWCEWGWFNTEAQAEDEARYMLDTEKRTYPALRALVVRYVAETEKGLFP